MDLCDNLMLRAIAEEVDRRGDEVNSWDPQSLSNMTLGYPIRGQGEGKHSNICWVNWVNLEFTEKGCQVVVYLWFRDSHLVFTRFVISICS